MSNSGVQVAVLTAGRDKPYALGLAAALAAQGVRFDFIGSNEVDGSELHDNPQINYLNLRGNQSVAAGPLQKAWRVLVYYFRLVFYAAAARPKIFHVLWNNKFEFLDRTLLMLYYKSLGKKVVLTAHNVNVGVRDTNDSWLNRATLKFQYRRCDHVFLHTEKMRSALVASFGIAPHRASVIPFGINSTVPDTELTGAEARQRLGLGEREKALLFFGNIAPYKGLQYLVDAFMEIARRDADYRLIIAGRPKGNEAYWASLLKKIETCPVRDRIILKTEYVPDAETEIYFKAADVLILPYTRIFQSGVLFLGYNFGLPAIVADVGSLKDEIIEGRTGFAFQAGNPADLARAIRDYFASDLYAQLAERRRDIRELAREHHSWSTVARITTGVYSQLLNPQ